MQQFWDHTLDWGAATLLTVNAGQTIPNINFSLTAGGSVSGIVVDAGNNTPLRNVQINANFGSWGTGTCTNADGTYTFSGLPAGTPFRISAGGNNNCNGGAQNYVQQFWDHTPDWGAATLLTVNAGQTIPNINFSLTAGGSVSGTVVDAGNNAPLGNMQISVEYSGGGTGGCTNPDGSYTLFGLPAGIPLTISAGGHNWCNGGSSNNSAPSGITYSDVDLVFGSPTIDVPLCGDWNADGKSGVGVFRTTNGLVYLRNTLTTGYSDISLVYGVAGDIPIAGRWIGGSNAAISILQLGKPTLYATQPVPRGFE